VEISESQGPVLFYTILKIGESVNANKTIVIENRLELHGYQSREHEYMLRAKSQNIFNYIF